MTNFKPNFAAKLHHDREVNMLNPTTRWWLDVAVLYFIFIFGTAFVIWSGAMLPTWIQHFFPNFGT